MFDIALYILALSIAAVAAYTDINSGRVKNIHLIVTLFAWIGIVALNTITSHAFPIPTISQIINAGFAIAIVTVLYLTDIWAPGDAKLFLTIVLVLPMNAYSARPGNIFPSLDLIMYSFAFGYVFLLGIMLNRKVYKNDAGHITTESNGKLNLKAAVLPFIIRMGFAVGVNTSVNVCFPEFVYANQALCLLAIIGVIYLISTRTTPLLRCVLGVVGWGAFLLMPCIRRISISGIAISVLESIIIALCLGFLNRQLKKNSYRIIPGNEVRPGMILSLSTIVAMQKCIEPDIPRTSTESRRTRLTKEQAVAVQRWATITKRDIIIVEMLPFAPFIALAVLYKLLRYALISFL